MNEIFNFQGILTHVFEKKKLAKYYLGLKWTNEEGGMHLNRLLSIPDSPEDAYPLLRLYISTLNSIYSSYE